MTPPPPLRSACRGKVLAYAAKLLGSADAEDVAQEVFIKVGRSLDSLADAAKLSSWIYAITLNTVRDLARKRSSGVDGLSRVESSTSDSMEEDVLIARVTDNRSRDPEETAIRNEMVSCFLLRETTAAVR